MSHLPVIYGTKGKIDILLDPSLLNRFSELTQRGEHPSALICVKLSVLTRTTLTLYLLCFVSDISCMLTTDRLLSLAKPHRHSNMLMFMHHARLLLIYQNALRHFKHDEHSEGYLIRL